MGLTSISPTRKHSHFTRTCTSNNVRRGTCGLGCAFRTGAIKCLCCGNMGRGCGFIPGGCCMSRLGRLGSGHLFSAYSLVPFNGARTRTNIASRSLGGFSGCRNVPLNVRSTSIGA